jgi:hypothetical protein
MPWKDQEYKKQYMREYARRPDQIAKRDAWRRAHLQLNQQYQKNWREKDPRNAIIVKSRSGAKFRGLEFAITVADLDWPTHCPVLGIELAYTGKGERRDNYPSLDRIDNSKGYVPGNVQVISWRANRIKWDCTPAELEAVLRYVSPPLTLVGVRSVSTRDQIDAPSEFDDCRADDQRGQEHPTR